MAGHVQVTFESNESSRLRMRKTATFDMSDAAGRSDSICSEQSILDERREANEC